MSSTPTAGTSSSRPASCRAAARSSRWPPSSGARVRPPASRARAPSSPPTASSSAGSAAPAPSRSVIREAQRVIVEREARLLLLGTPEQFGDAVPGRDASSCRSRARARGPCEVFVEPVDPDPAPGHRRPARRWRRRWPSWRRRSAGGATCVEVADFSAAELDARVDRRRSPPRGTATRRRSSRRSRPRPAFVGLVASRKRGEAVLGYLAERGVPAGPAGPGAARRSASTSATPRTARSRSPILAELVQLRAAGALLPGTGHGEPRPAAPRPLSRRSTRCAA